MGIMLEGTTRRWIMRTFVLLKPGHFGVSITARKSSEQNDNGKRFDCQINVNASQMSRVQILFKEIFKRYPCGPKGLKFCLRQKKFRQRLVLT